MAKTKEITFMCESANNQSTCENKIKVVAELRTEDYGELLNSIPKEDLYRFILDEVFEEWAEEHGYSKEVSVK